MTSVVFTVALTFMVIVLFFGLLASLWTYRLYRKLWRTPELPAAIGSIAMAVFAAVAALLTFSLLWYQKASYEADLVSRARPWLSTDGEPHFGKTLYDAPSLAVAITANNTSAIPIRVLRLEASHWTGNGWLGGYAWWDPQTRRQLTGIELAPAGGSRTGVISAETNRDAPGFLDEGKQLYFAVLVEWQALGGEVRCFTDYVLISNYISGEGPNVRERVAGITSTVPNTGQQPHLPPCRGRADR